VAAGDAVIIDCCFSFSAAAVGTNSKSIALAAFDFAANNT
jgi:hypothetical protein